MRFINVREHLTTEEITCLAQARSEGLTSDILLHSCLENGLEKQSHADQCHLCKGLLELALGFFISLKGEEGKALTNSRVQLLIEAIRTAIKSQVSDF